jgi:hypothetical protein
MSKSLGAAPSCLPLDPVAVAVPESACANTNARTGNVISPAAEIAKYGLDPFRFFLLREGGIEQDSDYSTASVEAIVNAYLSHLFLPSFAIDYMYTRRQRIDCATVLADTLGNLFLRSTTASLLPRCEVPAAGEFLPEDQAVVDALHKLVGTAATKYMYSCARAHSHPHTHIYKNAELMFCRKRGREIPLGRFQSGSGTNRAGGDSGQQGTHVDACLPVWVRVQEKECDTTAVLYRESAVEAEDGSSIHTIWYRDVHRYMVLVNYISRIFYFAFHLNIWIALCTLLLSLPPSLVWQKKKKKRAFLTRQDVTLEAVRILSLLLLPVMPDSMSAVLDVFSVPAEERTAKQLSFGYFHAGHPIAKTKPLLFKKVPARVM